MNYKKILYRVAQVVCLFPIIIMLFAELFAEKFLDGCEWLEEKFEIFELWAHDIPVGYFVNDPRIPKSERKY